MSWQLEPTDQYLRDAKRYAKKHPAEFLAVMENLEKFLVSLGVSPHPKLVQFGFLHEEPKGIRAIDQSGGALASGKKEANSSRQGFTRMPIRNQKCFTSFAWAPKQTKRRRSDTPLA